MDEIQTTPTEHNSDILEREDVSTEHPQITPEAIYQDKITKILEKGTIKNLTDEDGNVHTIAIDSDGTAHHLIVYKDGTHEVDEDASRMQFDFDAATKTVLLSVPEDENSQLKPKKHETAMKIFKGAAVTGAVFGLSALIWSASKSRHHSRPNQ
jgi:hypothetical protein